MTRWVQRLIHRWRRWRERRVVQDIPMETLTEHKRRRCVELIAPVGEGLHGQVQRRPYPRAEVVRQAGGWLTNFARHPWMWAAPVLGFAGPLIAAGALLAGLMAVWALTSLEVGLWAAIGISTLLPFAALPSC